MTLAPGSTGAIGRDSSRCDSPITKSRIHERFCTNVVPAQIALSVNQKRPMQSDLLEIVKRPYD